MRVFAGLPLPGETIGAVEAVCGELKEKCRGLKIVNTAGLHITLCFFGEVSEVQVEELKAIMDEPSLAVKKIGMRFSGTGHFPEKGNPRVIFMDIGEGAEEAASYHRIFNDLLRRKGFGIYDERKFVPHVTLARNRGAIIDPECLSTLRVPGELFYMDRLVLFKSVLKPAGAE